MGITSPTRWSAHSQEEWARRASNPDLPQWLRVTALAYGHHRRNGHAPFFEREVANYLATVNKQTGELKPDENASRAIATAVQYGFLSHTSTTRCLKVPHHAVWGGAVGNEFAHCRVCRSQ